MNCGRRNSGEAAAVGGDRLFWFSPPAEKPFTGGASPIKILLEQQSFSVEPRILSSNAS
jgi:hypothetical protein